MKYRIEFVDDLMTLLDEDGNGYDAYIVRADGRKEGELQLDIWARQYRFNVASAKRELKNLIQQM